MVDVLNFIGTVALIEACFLGEAFGGGFVDGPSVKSPQSLKVSSSSNEFPGVVLWIDCWGDFGGNGFADWASVNSPQSPNESSSHPGWDGGLPADC